MNLCRYQNALGVPGKGIHSYRFFNIAIMDVLMTLVLAYFISFVWKTGFVRTSIVLFALGIVLHRMFCVRTTVDKWLF